MVHIYIYIYIYMCVCVCVCVCMYDWSWLCVLLYMCVLASYSENVFFVPIQQWSSQVDLFVSQLQTDPRYLSISLDSSLIGMDSFFPSEKRVCKYSITFYLRSKQNWSLVIFEKWNQVEVVDSHCGTARINAVRNIKIKFMKIKKNGGGNWESIWICKRNRKFF